MSKINLLKIDQRKKSLLKRNKIFLSNKDAYKHLFDNLHASLIFDNSKIIASYYSILSEIRTDDLNRKIIQSGKTLCLPVINKISDSLIFRIFNNKTNIVKGRFNTYEPDSKSLEVEPDLLLVPCIAYDKFGRRLGYGGGYYDRTIKKIKSENPDINTVIIAFEEQKIKKVIQDEFDQILNYTLTEKTLYKVRIE